MSKFRFINIVDTFFISLATMLIIFVWLQFFIKNVLISLTLSILISLAIIYVTHRINQKKHTRYLNTESRNTELLKFKLAIQTLPNTKLISLIKKLIPSKYITKTVNGDIFAEKDGCTHILTTILNDKLSEQKLLETIKDKQSDHLTIFCLSFNNEIISICKMFKNKHINLINLEQLYEIFTQNNISIDTSNIDISKHKITLIEILKNIVSRNKSKGYFISGIVLLFTSLIIPYKLYYVVFSSILFILSIICRVRPHNKSATKSIID